MPKGSRKKQTTTRSDGSQVYHSTRAKRGKASVPYYSPSDRALETKKKTGMGPKAQGRTLARAKGAGLDAKYTKSMQTRKGVARSRLDKERGKK